LNIEERFAEYLNKKKKSLNANKAGLRERNIQEHKQSRLECPRE
jgi:hypothetical protein